MRIPPSPQTVQLGPTNCERAFRPGDTIQKGEARYLVLENNGYWGKAVLLGEGGKSLGITELPWCELDDSPAWTTPCWIALEMGERPSPYWQLKPRARVLEPLRCTEEQGRLRCDLTQPQTEVFVNEAIVWSKGKAFYRPIAKKKGGLIRSHLETPARIPLPGIGAKLVSLWVKFQRKARMRRAI